MLHTIFHLSASFPISITYSVRLNALNTDVPAKYPDASESKMQVVSLLEGMEVGRREGEEGEQEGGMEGAERCDP